MTTTINVPDSLKSVIGDVLRAQANAAIDRAAKALRATRNPSPEAAAAWVAEVFTPPNPHADYEAARADWLDAATTYAALWGDAAPDAAYWDRTMMLETGAAP